MDVPASPVGLPKRQSSTKTYGRAFKKRASYGGAGASSSPAPMARGGRVDASDSDSDDDDKVDGRAPPAKTTRSRADGQAEGGRAKRAVVQLPTRASPRRASSLARPAAASAAAPAAASKGNSAGPSAVLSPDLVCAERLADLLCVLGSSSRRLVKQGRPVDVAALERERRTCPPSLQAHRRQHLDPQGAQGSIGPQAFPEIRPGAACCACHRQGQRTARQRHRRRQEGQVARVVDRHGHRPARAAVVVARELARRHARGEDGGPLDARPGISSGRRAEACSRANGGRQRQRRAERCADVVEHPCVRAGFPSSSSCVAILELTPDLIVRHAERAKPAPAEPTASSFPLKAGPPAPPPPVAVSKPVAKARPAPVLAPNSPKRIRLASPPAHLKAQTPQGDILQQADYFVFPSPARNLFGSAPSSPLTPLSSSVAQSSPLRHPLAPSSPSRTSATPQQLHPRAKPTPLAPSSPSARRTLTKSASNLSALFDQHIAGSSGSLSSVGRSGGSRAAQSPGGASASSFALGSGGVDEEGGSLGKLVNLPARKRRVDQMLQRSNTAPSLGNGGGSRSGARTPVGKSASALFPSPRLADEASTSAAALWDVPVHLSPSVSRPGSPADEPSPVRPKLQPAKRRTYGGSSRSMVVAQDRSGADGEGDEGERESYAKMAKRWGVDQRGAGVDEGDAVDVSLLSPLLLLLCTRPLTDSPCPAPLSHRTPSSCRPSRRSVPEARTSRSSTTSATCWTDSSPTSSACGARGASRPLLRCVGALS